MTRARRELAWVVVALLAGIPAISPPASAANQYDTISETMVRGTSTGFSLQSQDDGFADVKTETGTSRIRWLKPTADVDADTWLQSGCGSSHFDCLNDDPVSDANVTYLTSTNVAQLTERFELEDWPGPYALTIDSATVFGWARTNSTPAGGNWDTAISTPGGVCLFLTPVLTLAYANYSIGYTEACGVGEGAFTSAILNGTRIYEICGSSPNSGCTVTASGLVVSYRDTFFLDFSSEFVGIPSDATNLRISYECTSIDSDTTLEVEHLGTTVGTINCDGSNREFSLSGDNGIVTVSFASPSQVDGTASTFSFDLLVLLADTTSGGGGGGEEDIFALQCRARVASIDCELRILPPVPPGIWITSSYWTSPGEARRVQENSTIHRVNLPYFNVRPTNVTVTATVTLNDASTARLSTVVRFDSSWLLMAGFGGGVAILIGWSYRSAAKHAREEAKRKASKERWENEYKIHAKILRWHQGRR